MVLPVSKKPRAVQVKAEPPRAPAPRRPAYAKSTRDEMSAGKGKALRNAAEKTLAAGPFSGTGPTRTPAGFRVGAGGGLVPTPAEGPQVTVLNPKLQAYLAEHPDVHTVQDLVNASYRQEGGGWSTFEQNCRDLDLDPLEVNRYRSANLQDWAVRLPPPEGVPSTVAEANEFFINQYKTDYNEYAADGVSTNCGPTSLAMCLEVQGKMPAGLNPEQRIDYARALMYPNEAASAYTRALDPNGNAVLDAAGNEVRLLDRDRALTAIGDGSRGIIAGAAGVGIEVTHQTGWGALDAALQAGHPVVVEGNITSAWRTTVTSHPPGTYAGGGDGHFIAILGKTEDGKYLVADPMYSGGTVALSADELGAFFSKQDGNPSFAAPPPPPASTTGD